MRVALFQPDIAANVAAIIRLAACFDVPLAIVEPCGFVWDERRLRRVGLDYLRHVRLARFASWSAFDASRRGGERLVLLTTGAERAYHEVAFRADDVLMVGRESAGAPALVHAAADLSVRVPMAPGRRSLNVVTALAIVLSEALRQTGGLAERAPP
ncbi:MAG: tRNA (cytidine(34)-2'-O)-methyltransferase [Geminicoccaceae bacterium]